MEIIWSLFTIRKIKRVVMNNGEGRNVEMTLLKECGNDLFGEMWK
jgi:hypothetical protein